MFAEISPAYLVALMFFLASACYMYISVATFVSTDDSKMRRDYLTTGVFLFSCSLFYGLMTIAVNENLVRIFWALGFLGSSMFFPWWLIFLTNMVELRNKYSLLIIRALFALTFLITLLCILSNDTTFIVTDYGSRFNYRFNPFFLAHIVIILVNSAILFSLHIRWWREAEIKRLRMQALAFIVSAAFVSPIALMSDIILPNFTNRAVMSLIPFCVLISSTVVFLSLKKNRTLSVTVPNVSEFFFKSSTMPTLVLDHNNIITIENQAALDFLTDSVIGRNISEIIKRETTPTEQDLFSNDFKDVAVPVSTTSGVRTCEVNNTIERDKYDYPLCKVVILNDITDLVEAREMAEQSNRAKSDFLAKMSHEIRTPMNAIIGMTELAMREDIPDDLREYIVIVKQAGVNLLGIINDILDFSKIESGNMQIVPSDYQLSSLINDVVSIIRMRAVDSHLRFTVDLNSNIPDMYYGDETRIRQVLINILGNAVKYTEKGFVTLKVDGELVDNNTINLIIDIKDSGIGIKKEDSDKLFRDYFQFDLEANKNVEGIGLGLAISWSLTKAMNGNITVSSEYGKGSVFTITLPQKIRNHDKMAVVTDPDKKDAIVFERRMIHAWSIYNSILNLGVECILVNDNNAFKEQMENKSFSFIFISHILYEQNKELIEKSGADSQVILLSEFGESILSKNKRLLYMPAHVISIANVFNDVTDRFSYNISSSTDNRIVAPDASVLIVDDVATNIKVARGLLLPYEVRVGACISGKDALNAVKSKKYDLIFMDHHMSEMDGIEVTKIIREMGRDDPYYTDIPIIALTANAISGMRELFLESGLNDFISKPIDTVELSRVMEKWIPIEKQIQKNKS